MIFSSTLFLCMFLPISLLGFYLRQGERRNSWLLFVSFIFYAWSQPSHLWILFLSIVVNFYFALLIERSGSHRKLLRHRKLLFYRKLLLFIAAASNLFILFYFRYVSSVRDTALPVGISLLAFQGISYLTDVYRKEVPAQKKLRKAALYMAMFPKLTAGPVVRYKHISDELERREVTKDDLGIGIERFIRGLAKKVIIADTLAVAADAIWRNGASGNTWIIAWAGSIAYTLQIYYDFSGYSDMAIGLGRMFGFHFMENFDLPYAAESMTQFWRKWNISLMSWFRDYVYIPLGGNRKHVYRNLAAVFLLTGFWHGPSWHFLAWGLWHGTFVILERAAVKHGLSPDNFGKRHTVLAKAYTLLTVHFGWILFRAPSLKEAIAWGGAMFGFGAVQPAGYTLFWYLDRWTIAVMLAGMLFASSLPKKAAAAVSKHISENTAAVMKYTVLLLLLYLSMIRIVSGTYRPFIYFQF